jgi:hypothetical protein
MASERSSNRGTVSPERWRREFFAPRAASPAFFVRPVAQRRTGPDGLSGAAAPGSAATGLPEPLRGKLHAASGYALYDVRVRYDSPAPQRVGAHAYARGTDIHLGPGQEKHLAHEAWHVVQQKQGRVPATTYAGGAAINDDPALEKEADEMAANTLQRTAKPAGDAVHGTGCGACAAEAVVQREAAGAVVQFVRPTNLVNHTFLDRGVEVDPTMRDRLRAVQDHLQTQYDALPAASRPASLREYAGLNTIGGWRESTSQHGTGRAVDVNAQAQPYIATRTSVGGTTTYGGEEGGATDATRALRRPAVEVYDRAVAFVRTNPYDDDVADVANRRTGESATDAYRRFAYVSESLAAYLSLALHATLTRIDRAPVNDPENVAEAALLAAIPLTERKDETTAVADIQALMDDIFWQSLHPAYPLTAREQYIRILRDYEIVRRPMQHGAPSTSPASTRNPARGFLHMPEHFVVAMMDVGRLRWGACEFSERSNGDVHHFDLRAPYRTPAPAPPPAAAPAVDHPAPAVPEPEPAAP